MATLVVIAAPGPTWAHTGGPRRGRGAGSRRAHAMGVVRWAPRRRAPLAGEAVRDADGGRRTTGAACPARRGTEALPRKPCSGAAARRSRGGPSSRTRPPPRGRQHSCITRWRKSPTIRETWPCAHSREAQSALSRGPIWVTPPPSVSTDEPFVELHERHSTAVLPMSNGAPPAASGTTWSTVRSAARWAGRW
jgi:hypothetical protein